MLKTWKSLWKMKKCRPKVAETSFRKPILFGIAAGVFLSFLFFGGMKAIGPQSGNDFPILYLAGFLLFIELPVRVIGFLPVPEELIQVTVIAANGLLFGFFALCLTAIYRRLPCFSWLKRSDEPVESGC